MKKKREVRVEVVEVGQPGRAGVLAIIRLARFQAQVEERAELEAAYQRSSVLPTIHYPSVVFTPFVKGQDAGMSVGK